jgi:hypothetical protein
MSKVEKLCEFKKKFLELTRTAANDGVPLGNLILELETEKFRLQAINFQRVSEREAVEVAKSIVPASGIPPIDFKNN